MKSHITVRLDRLRVVSWAPRGGWRLPRLRGFDIVKDHRLSPLNSPTYERIRRLKSRASDTKVHWHYKRRVGWVKPWRITIIADDQKGITAKEVASILGRCRHYRFVLAELAIDFSDGSPVDRDFVKKHGIFGKSRRRTDRGGKGQLRYGARKSAKLVRCYRKKQIQAYRVEVEVHSQLLKKHHIEKRDDVPDVALIVHPKHFRFVRIRWKVLRRYMKARFGDGAEKVMEATREHAEVSLTKALKYLRGMGVTNTHRFLTPMHINKAVAEALMKWLMDFEEGLNG